MGQAVRVTTGARSLVASPDKVLSVGRDPDSDLCLDDERVSRSHARVYHRAGSWVYEDLGSTNGSFLNGGSIRTAALDAAISIRIGDVVDGPLLDFTILDASESLLPPPGARQTLHRIGAVASIGRALDNTIVIDDLVVSRHHAEIARRSDGGYIVRDLGSFNGTYVNGRQVTEERLSIGDEVTVGARILRVTEGGVEERLDTESVLLYAKDLVVALPDGRRLLDGVTFNISESTMMAIVGPTGAGKSTLMNALAGFRPADSGRLDYAHRDLYRYYKALGSQIGYVPQQDIVHLDLTPRTALQFAAELRFPRDTRTGEREARVGEVLRELGLHAHADTQIRKLSGGQRKRTSIGLELLTRPSLLLLDEPTSGLDPGYERELMVLFRQIASRGRAVVLVTHSVQSLDVCDRILFLAPGGRVAFFGPPRDALRFFERADYASVFRYLESETKVDWASRYAASSWHRDLIVSSSPVHQRSEGAEPPDPQQRPVAQRAHQFMTLTRRYLRLLAADRKNLLLLAGQGPLIGLLLLAATQTDRLSPGHQGASLLILTLVVSGTFIGAANSIREIVKERPIVDRERAWGQSVLAYLGSKVAVLSVLTLGQSMVLVPLAIWRHGGPAAGLVTPSPLVELVVIIALSGIAAMSLGLLISAQVRTPDLALTLLPVLLVAQLIFTGALFPFRDSPVIRELSYLASAKWGYVSAAAVTGVRDLELCEQLEAERRAPAHCEVAPERTSQSLGTAIGMLMVLALSALGLTSVALSRRPNAAR